MEHLAPHEFGAILLSVSFLAALVAGGLAGWLGGLLCGAGVGALVVAAFSLSAAWITWQGGDQPDAGTLRVEGVVTVDADTAHRAWTGEPRGNHDFLIRYRDTSGREHAVTGGYSKAPLTPGERVLLDYRPGRPDAPEVVEPGRHRLILAVFLLFGTVPLTMGLAFFAAAWEQRPGARTSPPVRPVFVTRACAYARILANLTLLGGFAVTAIDTGAGAFTTGFPLIGAGALAHALIGAVAGMRLTGVLTFVVVGTGFVGFGLLARAAGIGL